jgi:hypothetical protein
MTNLKTWLNGLLKRLQAADQLSLNIICSDYTPGAILRSWQIRFRQTY